MKLVEGKIVVVSPHGLVGGTFVKHGRRVSTLEKMVQDEAVPGDAVLIRDPPITGYVPPIHQLLATCHQFIATHVSHSYTSLVLSPLSQYRHPYIASTGIATHALSSRALPGTPRHAPPRHAPPRSTTPRQTVKSKSNKSSFCPTCLM